MTINDLRMDIITAVSQSTDVDALEKNRADLWYYRLRQG